MLVVGCFPSHSRPMTFRKIIFWTHLVIGLAAGLVIALMALTGAMMAFEKQITTWAERDARHVTVSTNEPPLSLREILQAVREDQPEARPQNITVSRDPGIAVMVSLNRTNTLYVNPYTGEIKSPGSQKVRDFFQFLERVHRWLGVSPQRQEPPPNANAADGASAPASRLRQFTSTVIGISVCVFLALCISGLVVWWPRKWNWRALRPSVWFVRGQRGKARDWNWHNVFGFWLLPVLIVITFTGIVMHFRSVGDWIYQRPEGDAANAGLNISTPEPGQRPLGQDALLAIVQKEIPHWETISFRSAMRRGRGGGRNFSSQGGGGQHEGQREERGENASRAGRGDGRPGESRGPQPVSISVTERGWSPVPVQLQLDPYTGEILRKESLGDLGFRRAFRSMNKSLHTGEWGGWFGQLLAFIAAIGALVLVWTGFAISWRRFFGRP